MTLKPTRLAFALLAVSGVTLLSLPGCSSCKKEPPPAPVDLTPAATAPPDAGVVEIKPLDDAGDAAPEPSGPARPRTPSTPSNPNVARIKQCCNAIRHEAKNLGAAPEATMMIGIAAQCDLVALQIGGGSAPEFGQVRQMLKGHTVPAACSGM